MHFSSLQMEQSSQEKGIQTDNVIISDHEVDKDQLLALVKE